MATFTLDSSTLAGTSDTQSRTRLSGFSRWFQFKITHTANYTLTVLGLLVSWVPAGERRER